MTIEWVDGPPTRYPSKAQLVAEHLRQHAGQWAVIARRANVLFPWWRDLQHDPRFEVERRRSDPRDQTLLADVDVYARYVGDAGERIRTEGATAD